MRILPIPCLQDNYAYLIVDEQTREAAAVDPVEPKKVFDVAKSLDADLKLVLTTHHHWDHAGGNEKVKQMLQRIEVCGGALDNVKACTKPLSNGDTLSLGDDVKITALHTPCHTKGHISYYVTNQAGEEQAVFTGDTLFVAGCGKFFEGTAEEMHKSLCVTLGALPEETRVFCGHEYTEKNLRFALTVEPENKKIADKLSWAQEQRGAKLPTIPSTVGEELETNPFMRVHLEKIQAKVGCHSPVEALAELRKLKDNWRG